jgi:hypothetical protein
MRPPEGLAWKLNRLRCMSPAEVAHRTRRAVALRAEGLGWIGQAAAPEADLEATPQPWVFASDAIESWPYVKAAERIAAGRLDVFALEDYDLGSPPAWNRDPKTGIEAPMVFGPLLDYRDTKTVGDPKYLWEINRHQHLVTLAQAFALTGDTRYFEVIRRHLESWFTLCPPRKGPNWSSANEAGLRLMNWSVAWQLLGGADSPLFETAEGAQLRRRWLQSVHEQMRFVREGYSLYSSANNHLIGEAAGVFIAALTWPHWPEAARWGDEARVILEREILAQNADDGVNLEQAFSYQQYEIDMLLFAWLAARANGAPMSDAYGERLLAMMEFLSAVMDAGGNVPMVGDSDDGIVVRFTPHERFCRYRSVLATGALLFGRADLKLKARSLDDKTRWLIGPDADARFDALSTPQAIAPPRRAFAKGGYYILGSDFETAREIRIVADAGPLGYGSIAAHGHADALSFTLSQGGLEFLIDPGTFAYHTEGEWRNYFRGTSAHNTLRIDRRDQSVPGGNFMWLRKAAAVCSEWATRHGHDRFEGHHDGYTALVDPVAHSRSLTLDKGTRTLTIEDRLVMRGEHEVELFFHFHEGCRLEDRDGITVATREDRALRLEPPRMLGASVKVHTGDTSPILGWVSRRFDVREPSPTLAWRAKLKGPQVLTTTIQC